MRKCYAMAIVLISWFLMLPPPIFPPVKNPGGDYAVNVKAPLSQWLTFKTFDSKSACNAELKKMPPYYRCVASVAPELKGAAAQPQPAPSTSTAAGAAGAHMQ